MNRDYNIIELVPRCDIGKVIDKLNTKYVIKKIRLSVIVSTIQKDIYIYICICINTM